MPRLPPDDRGAAPSSRPKNAPSPVRLHLRISSTGPRRRTAASLARAHASDIQLVFDNIEKPGASAIGPKAQPMADQMSETFIAFARTGNPNNRQIPRWEPYTLRRRQTMVFDTPSHLEDDPARRRAAPVCQSALRPTGHVSLQTENYRCCA